MATIGNLKGGVSLAEGPIATTWSESGEAMRCAVQVPDPADPANRLVVTLGKAEVLELCLSYALYTASGLI